MYYMNEMKNSPLECAIALVQVISWTAPQVTPETRIYLFLDCSTKSYIRFNKIGLCLILESNVDGRPNSKSRQRQIVLVAVGLGYNRVGWGGACGCKRRHRCRSVRERGGGRDRYQVQH